MNKLFKTFLAGLAVLSLASCKKNNYVVDKDPIALPEYSQLILPNYAPRDYFIDNSGTSKYTIPVGFTNLSNEDRTISISYTSPTGAQPGTQYNAPTSVLIKAGEAVSKIDVSGIFAGYNNGRVDSLKVKIEQLLGGSKTMVGKDSVWLIMRQYCGITNFATQFGGDYDNTMEPSYGPYTTSVSNIVPIAAAKANANIENLYDYGGFVIGNFDWSVVGNNNLVIPAKYTGVDVTSGGTPYQLWIKTNTGSKSTFSACDNTITVFVDVMGYSMSGTYVGNFSTNYKIVMAR
ncbi:MAG: hypothetical protein LC122_10210 [Chitinophagales bacterium]|nr:hypothetical protein [Chitinophagales bacterium]